MTETTRERAIRLALEAGFWRDSFGLYQPNRSVVDYDLTPVIETLIRLARGDELAAEQQKRAADAAQYQADEIEWNEQLAAAQATIEQMRGAIGAWERADGNKELQEAEAKLIEAMNAPANLDALHEAMDKEREECAAICDRFYERGMNPAECAGAIRARKEEK